MELFVFEQHVLFKVDSLCDFEFQPYDIVPWGGARGQNLGHLGLFLIFLAHLSRRLIGELIVYRSSRCPSVRASVRPSVHTFKHEYLCNQ